MGYEYSAVTRNLVPVAAKAAVVERIYQLYADGIGSPSIVKILAEDHVPSPAGNPRWNDAQIMCIIKNPVYKGVLVFNKESVRSFLDHKASKIDESDYQYTKGTFAPIVSAELWDTCNQLLSTRKSHRRQKPKTKRTGRASRPYRRD